MQDKLHPTVKFAYGAGVMGGAMTTNILAFFALFFLTNVAGLDPALAGSVLLVGNIWDAFNDPLIGTLSDRCDRFLPPNIIHRWGKRYPWMLAGGISLGIAFFLVWFIPPFEKDWQMFAYYSFVAILFFSAYTSVMLPASALAPELTRDYDERTSLMSFRSAFSIGGGMCGLLLAKSIFAVMATGPERYLVLGAIGGMFAIVPTYFSIWGTYPRFQKVRYQQPPQDAKRLPFKQQVKTILSNRPYLLVIGIYLCSWLAAQLTASILPYFVVNWMKLSENHLVQAAIAVQGTALAAVFGWSVIGRRFGKKIVYLLGVPLWLIAQVGLLLLQPDSVGWMYFFAVMVGIGLSTAYLVPWSMFPDVVDYDELLTGERREGIFYGFTVFLEKLGTAIALFLVGRILAIAGFISIPRGETAPPPQPESAMLAIRLIISPLPAILLIFGLILAYFYPISREVYQEIYLKLMARRRGEEREWDLGSWDSGIGRRKRKRKS
ncbi:MFS transporter [Geitlerinema sp. PCC 9228]|jgi:GPH family glycoside/pentoside/hexuronide:cation symporter|uniref:MFS transporter n=1 Tax=Geitlerinema sp. PCC 9228 TaxID=111611 RepID=UPI0008F9C069|nr:MFS transporter [Geitlerinema sp. PCC 9228]